jgi:hypothetical protein
MTMGAGQHQNTGIIDEPNHSLEAFIVSSISFCTCTLQVLLGAVAQLLFLRTSYI